LFQNVHKTYDQRRQTIKGKVKKAEGVYENRAYDILTVAIDQYIRGMKSSLKIIGFGTYGSDRQFWQAMFGG
jgi:hypothetical protein